MTLPKLAGILVTAVRYVPMATGGGGAAASRRRLDRAIRQPIKLVREPGALVVALGFPKRRRPCRLGIGLLLGKCKVWKWHLPSANRLHVENPSIGLHDTCGCRAGRSTSFPSVILLRAPRRRGFARQPNLGPTDCHLESRRHCVLGDRVLVKRGISCKFGMSIRDTGAELSLHYPGSLPVCRIFESSALGWAPRRNSMPPLAAMKGAVQSAAISSS